MKRSWLISIALFTLILPVCLGQDAPEPSLGDIARQLRREKDEKEKKTQNVIDNENINQLMNEMQSKKFNSTTLLFSLDKGGQNFKVSAPDVSCNLSFSGKAMSLLSDPFVVRSLPATDFAKLDGPAAIQGNTLQVSFFNGTGWNVKELIIGVTILRTPPPSRIYGPALLRPASDSVVEITQRRPDQTMIYHLRGSAAPQTTTVFTAELTSEFDPQQEWHWAIVGAKGVPVDSPAASSMPSDASSVTPPIQPAAPIPATSTGNPHP